MPRRKPLLFSLVVLVVVWASQTWACSSSCRALAVRVPPASLAVKQDGMKSVFHGRRPSPLDSSFTYAAVPPPAPPAGRALRSTPPEDLAESKRRVPSCPDPLHNRYERDRGYYWKTTATHVNEKMKKKIPKWK